MKTSVRYCGEVRSGRDPSEPGRNQEESGEKLLRKLMRSQVCRPKAQGKPRPKPGCRPVRRLKADYLKKKALRAAFRQLSPLSTWFLPGSDTEPATIPHDKAADRFGRKVPSTPAPDDVRYTLLP